MAEITADVGVASGAEVRLGWAVNSGTPQKGVNGPANFANHQQFDETHTTSGLFGAFPHGDFPIQPFVRVSGSAGATATIVHNCV